MTHSFEYHGFAVVVKVEADIGWKQKSVPGQPAGFVSTVRVLRSGTAIALFSPLRFGDAGGRPFATEADALAGGCNAARKIIDDLFGQQSH